MNSDSILVRTKEGKEFPIKKTAAMLSNLLKKYIEENKISEPITLEEVEEKIIDKIYEYLDHFNGQAPKDIEKPLQTNDMKNATDEWSANFVDKISQQDLISLTTAASYMEITTLVDLCCAKLACMCQDKSEEEIFKVFNINETFTEDEKNKLREDNKWIEGNLD
jgi:hypothetical protein